MAQVAFKNVPCKESERKGRDGNSYTNYVGFVEIGGKLYKIQPNPEVSESTNRRSNESVPTCWVRVQGPYPKNRDRKRGL